MNRWMRNRSSHGETRRQPLQGRSGFTLTELLVTMAIITLLLGLLIPCIRGPKWDADQLRKGQDLKSLFIALLAYTGDYDGSFPKVTNLKEADQQVRQALEPYLKDKEFFNKLPPLVWRYPSLNSVKLDQIRDPGHTPIAGSEQFSPERGKEKVLVLFADGHVERLTQEELGELLMSDIVTGRPKGTVTSNPDGSKDIS